MRFDKFELSVAVPSKHNQGYTKIPEYASQGLGFVEGRKNQPFILKLRNDCAQRVLSVVSIDGINIVDGQPCTPGSRGYIVPAYSTVDIQGWRTSLQEVSAFVFETKDQAYAKSVAGTTQNCGVIAAKFFSEKWKPNPLLDALKKASSEEHHHHHHHYPPYIIPLTAPAPTVWPGPIYTSSGPQYTCSAKGDEGLIAVNNLSQVTGNVTACAARVMDSSIPDFKLGTGWGAAKADSVYEINFEREAEICTITLYYAEAVDLEKAGISLAKDLAVTPSAPVLPQAFGFCKPPVSR